MKIVVNYNGEYKDMVNSYYNLESLDDNSKEEVLFQGYNTSRDPKLREEHKTYKKRCYMNLEAPCSFTSTLTSISEQNYFTHVYTLCPYTCDWVNGTTSTKYIPIPFPFNIDSFKDVKYGNKEYDVMYMGTLMNQEHLNIIDVMKNFKYIHTSLSTYRAPYTPTHINVNSGIKWDLLSKSKISVAMNLAPINDRHINTIKRYSGWEGNKAFNNLDKHYLPQFKPRVIESMVCKTLVLVKRDWWNVMEYWFEADKHFIYWDSIEDLKDKITHIINNYEDYQDIIDAAYDKVMEYEINKIFKTIQND
jgi:hypothetical protein